MQDMHSIRMHCDPGRRPSRGGGGGLLTCAGKGYLLHPHTTPLCTTPSMPPRYHTYPCRPPPPYIMPPAHMHPYTILLYHTPYTRPHRPAQLTHFHPPAHPPIPQPLHTLPSEQTDACENITFVCGQ